MYITSNATTTSLCSLHAKVSVPLEFPSGTIDEEDVSAECPSCKVSHQPFLTLMAKSMVDNEATLGLTNTASQEQWSWIFTKRAEWSSQVAPHRWQIKDAGVGETTGPSADIFRGQASVTVVGDEKLVLILTIICGNNKEQGCLPKVACGYH